MKFKYIFVSIILALVVAFLVSFQPQKQRQVHVRIIDKGMSNLNPEETKKHILEMTKQGYVLKSIVPYPCGSTTHGCFMIVMER